MLKMSGITCSIVNCWNSGSAFHSSSIRRKILIQGLMVYDDDATMRSQSLTHSHTLTWKLRVVPTLIQKAAHRTWSRASSRAQAVAHARGHRLRVLSSRTSSAAAQSTGDVESPTHAPRRSWPTRISVAQNDTGGSISKCERTLSRSREGPRTAVCVITACSRSAKMGCIAGTMSAYGSERHSL